MSLRLVGAGVGRTGTHSLKIAIDAEAWWRSADRTIFEVARRRLRLPGMEAWDDMVQDLLALRFTEGWRDRETAVRAYERHNQARGGFARPRDRPLESPPWNSTELRRS